MLLYHHHSTISTFLYLILLLAIIIIIIPEQVMADEEDDIPMLYDLQATCLGSTGHAAVLEVRWFPIPTIQESVQGGQGQLGGGSSSQQTPTSQKPPFRRPFQFPNLGPRRGGMVKTEHTIKSVPAKLLLLGELDLLDSAHTQPVDIADNQAHVQVPEWAMQRDAYVSLILKQADVIVGRLEFLRLSGMCGHHPHESTNEHGHSDGKEVNMHLEDIRIE